MRRTVASEESHDESRPTRYKLTPPEVKKEQVEAVVVAAPRTTQARKGLPLWVLATTLAFLAILALITTNQQGTALTNLPGQINVRSIYNVDTINKTKALALLKLGNRKGAMALVLTLPYQYKENGATDPEFSQIRADLITAQLAAGEFTDALKVATQVPLRIGDVLQVQGRQEGISAALANARTLPASLQREKENGIIQLSITLARQKNWEGALQLLESLETPFAKDLLINELMRTFPKNRPLSEGFTLAKQTSSPLLQKQALTTLGEAFLNPFDEAKCLEILGHLNTKTEGADLLAKVVSHISSTDPQRAFALYQQFQIQDDFDLLQTLGHRALEKKDYVLAEQIADLMTKAPMPKTKMGHRLYSSLMQSLQSTNFPEALRIAQKAAHDPQGLSVLEQLGRWCVEHNEHHKLSQVLESLKKLPGPEAAQRYTQLAAQSPLKSP